jgi:hypothetical protein
LDSAHLSIGMKVISWIIGLFSFYLFSNLPRKEKRLQLEKLTSQLINFILFIWVGKIILDFSIFIRNPLVILAYPSNSSAFYFAFFLTIITVVYKSKRGRVDFLGLFGAFFYVFLISSFAYEFIQIVWNDNRYALAYFILLAVLSLIYLFAQNRVRADQLALIMLIGWSAGALGLSFSMPLMMVFGYTMHAWFLVLLLFSSITAFIFRKRKKVI